MYLKYYAGLNQVKKRDLAPRGAWRGVGGAKSSEKASFGPARCVSQVLRGAKSSKKASFGPAAASYRPAASDENPPGHMRAPGVQYCQYDML